MEIKKIMVPLDGSEEADKAFAFGLDMAEKYKATLLLVHVVDMNEKMSALDQVTMSGYVPAEVMEEGYKLLGRYTRQVPPSIPPGYGGPHRSTTADAPFCMAGEKGGPHHHGKPWKGCRGEHSHGQREPVHSPPRDSGCDDS